MKKNAFYAQSGGVTAVINATAGALLLEAKNHKNIKSKDIIEKINLNK